MSYLIDALKKAERERHASRDRDLRTASAQEVHLGGGRGQRWLALVVVLLVMINGGLLFYLWHPAEVEASLQASDRSSSGSRTLDPRTEPSVIADGSRTDGAGQPPPSRRIQRPVSGAGNERSADTRPIEKETGPSGKVAKTTGAGPRQQSTSFEDSAGRAGDGAGSARSSADSNLSVFDEPDVVRDDDASLNRQSQITDVPQVRINGQLFSSVPGRSFILVDRRRYHEGQRLAAGPAVESIGPSGATLRFHGQRYHVPGPGGG